MMPKIRHVIAVFAIITGAVATFDVTIIPSMRYPMIIGCVMIILGVLIFSIQEEAEQTHTDPLKPVQKHR